VQAARAAQAAGVPFCLSTVSICSIEEVSAGSTAPFWFQLYVIRDRGYAKELLARAQAAGCTTLVFTVDLPVFATRYRDVRNGMTGGTVAVRQDGQAGTSSATPAGCSTCPSAASRSPSATSPRPCPRREP
jgi:L-lactate dehydrogenase (cytochrome)